jgi:hypothetical protein
MNALFQQYLFKAEIQTPDGNTIFPMLIFRSSFLGPRPALELHFGAFRFICSNGMISSYPGIKQSYIAANAKNWKGLEKLEIAAWFHQAFETLEKKAVFYKRLNDLSLSENQKTLFSEKKLPLGLRKNVLSSLEYAGNISVDIKTGKKREPAMKAGYLKDTHLWEENINNSINLLNDVSLWSVYNFFTNSATLNSQLSAKFITDSQKINDIFTRVAAH